MNSFYCMLILLTIYKCEGLYQRNGCTKNEKESESVNCEKSSICGGEAYERSSTFCLPWKHFDKDNGTWQNISKDSNLTCNTISCNPDNSRSICNILSTPIYYISTSSTVDISFYRPYFHVNILVIGYINDNCVIGALCRDCTLVKDIMKDKFAECQHLNITINYHKITINNLTDNQLIKIYFISVINETSVASVEEIFVKTKKKNVTVENVTVTKLTSTSMTIRWEKDKDVNMYCLEGFYHNVNDMKFDKNSVTLNYLNPCQEYCFYIKAIISENRIAKSERRCVLTRPNFSEIELLPIKSDLLTYKQINWKYNQNANKCKIKFVVQYGINQTLFHINTTSNYLNLTNLEQNQIYLVKVFPVSGEEEGKFATKRFLTMKTDNLFEDYIKTDEFMAQTFQNSRIFSIEYPDVNAKDEFFNFPLFAEQSRGNLLRQMKENFERVSKRIGIKCQLKQNRISVSLDVMDIDYDKTIEFILTLMNQPNKCILITDCTDCNKIHRNKTVNAIAKMQLGGAEFCKMDQHSNELKDKKENSDFISKITIKFSNHEETISIHSLDLSNKNVFQDQILWLLGLIIILLVIILILFADKKGFISTDEIIKAMSGRKQFRNYIRECCTGKSVSQVNRVSSDNNNIVMNRPIRNSIKIRNSETIDPNHPNFPLILEYGKICKQALNREKLNFTFKIANLPENLRKNRFKNILPFDQTRVTLQSRNSNTDYINASLIPFLDDPAVPEYIAAQGPLVNTITDFWYMIWEENVSVIVMLTKVYEGLNLKCEQYWPSSINEEYAFDEDLTLSVVMEEEIFYNSFVERKFKLMNKDLNQVRKITQIHMQKWNDFSKPKKHDFQECIIRFHEITASKNSAPYLIHCSAGVGRTGTFIAIDRLIKKRLKEKVDMKTKDVVLDLRIYRHNMVQQESQYIFIHKFMDFFSRKFKMQGVYCQTDEVSDEITDK